MELINAASSPETQMNGNFQTLEWAQVYGRRVPVTTGLTWGYYGGVMWGGIAVADGTLTLTDAAANYIVVDKTTGAISVSTDATNWNDTAYARVYKVTAAAGVVSAVEDHRAGANGIFAGAGGGAVTVADTLPVLEQGQQWYESDTAGFYMRYVNPDATQTLISLSTTGGDFMPASGATGRFADGTLAAPGISWTSESTSGWYRGGAGSFSFAVGGAEKLRVTSTNVTTFGGLGSNVTSDSVYGVVSQNNANQAFGIQSYYPNFLSGWRGQTNYHFRCADNGGDLFYVWSNGGIWNNQANNVNASDATIKQNIVPAPDYTAFVGQLQFKRFSYIDFPNDGETDGLLAQDVAALDSALVTTVNDKLGVYEQRLQQRINSVVPKLIERIRLLEEKLAALESR